MLAQLPLTTGTAPSLRSQHTDWARASKRRRPQRCVLCIRPSIQLLLANSERPGLSPPLAVPPAAPEQPAPYGMHVACMRDRARALVSCAACSPAITHGWVHPAAVATPPHIAAECFFAGRPNLVRRSVQSLFAQPFTPLSDDGEQGWRRHRECAWHEAHSICDKLQCMDALLRLLLVCCPYIGPHICEASPLMRPPLRPCRGRRLWRESVSNHGGAARYGPTTVQCVSCGASGQTIGRAAAMRHHAPACLLAC